MGIMYFIRESEEYQIEKYRINFVHFIQSFFFIFSVLPKKIVKEITRLLEKGKYSERAVVYLCRNIHGRERGRSCNFN